MYDPLNHLGSYIDKALKKLNLQIWTASRKKIYIKLKICSLSKFSYLIKRAQEVINS